MTFVVVMTFDLLQLRIDFRLLDLAQPVLTAQMDGTGSTTECSDEYLLVNGVRLCGFSQNQHSKFRSLFSEFRFQTNANYSIKSTSHWINAPKWSPSKSICPAHSLRPTGTFRRRNSSAE